MLIISRHSAAWKSKTIDKSLQQKGRGNMQTFSWNVFTLTGDIEAYLLFKESAFHLSETKKRTKAESDWGEYTTTDDVEQANV